MSKPKDGKEFEEKREQMALRYEHVLRHIYGESTKIKNKIRNWMSLNAPRGGAEGYAEADLWRDLNRDSKVTDLDVGFVIALEGLAHKLAYLERRLEQLESKSR